jgi:hypothetical protein
LANEEHLPELRSIRAPRHPGVSAAVCANFSEAADICLARHHGPPPTPLNINCVGKESTRILKWCSPDETARRSWRNRDDATRDAAYGISLAVVEHELGMVALSRADTRSGADYYVGTPEAVDLEEAFRLEVSGIDAGDLADIRRRLKTKEGQLVRGDVFLPGYASIVGFRQAVVLVSRVEDPARE